MRKKLLEAERFRWILQIHNYNEIKLVSRLAKSLVVIISFNKDVPQRTRVSRHGDFIGRLMVINDSSQPYSGVTFITYIL